jgi:hypothetical protein
MVGTMTGGEMTVIRIESGRERTTGNQIPKPDGSSSRAPLSFSPSIVRGSLRYMHGRRDPRTTAEEKRDGKSGVPGVFPLLSVRVTLGPVTVEESGQDSEP